MKQEDIKNQMLEQELSDDDLDGAAGGVSGGDKRLLDTGDGIIKS